MLIVSPGRGALHSGIKTRPAELKAMRTGSKNFPNGSLGDSGWHYFLFYPLIPGPCGVLTRGNQYHILDDESKHIAPSGKPCPAI